MRLIADGGSTKVDWVLSDDNGNIVERHRSVGINPSLLSDEHLMTAVKAVSEEFTMSQHADVIEYYGAGCTPAASERLKVVLKKIYPAAVNIVVGSDIIGAAKSLLGNKTGIACILGTGACSCLWDRTETGEMGIVGQTPSLGYILGDEGSGAVLGKSFINALYKERLPHEIREEFEQEYGIDMYGVIEKVYRQSQPNRWLASLSPFIFRHLDIREIEALVSENLRCFLVRNILPYNRPDLPVSFIGSIAFYYERQLRAEAEKMGLIVGTILKSPFDREFDCTRQ